jgi:hypothetical protein
VAIFRLAASTRIAEHPAMKYAWLGVAAFCGTAAADPTINIGDMADMPKPPEQAPHGVSLEVGPEIGHIAFVQAPLTTQTHATTKGVHFGPHINLSRNFYLAAGLDVAWFSTNGVNQEQVLNYNPVDSSGMIVPIDGSFTTLTAAVGAREFVGAFSGGVELGGGVRYLQVHDVTASSLGTGYVNAVGVARARIEFWMTTHLTLTAVAEMDLQEARDVNFGIMLGAHSLRYDAAR